MSSNPHLTFFSQDIASDDSGQDGEFAPPAHEDEDDEEDLDADERDDDVPSSSAAAITSPAKRKRPNLVTQSGGLEVDELGGDFGDELGGEEFSGFYQGGEEVGSAMFFFFFFSFGRGKGR